MINLKQREIYKDLDDCEARLHTVFDFDTPKIETKYVRNKRTRYIKGLKKAIKHWNMLRAFGVPGSCSIPPSRRSRRKPESWRNTGDCDEYRRNLRSLFGRFRSTRDSKLFLHDEDRLASSRKRKLTRQMGKLSVEIDGGEQYVCDAATNTAETDGRKQRAHNYTEDAASESDCKGHGGTETANAGYETEAAVN